jgi:hypothetical protein
LAENPLLLLSFIKTCSNNLRCKVGRIFEKLTSVSFYYEILCKVGGKPIIKKALSGNCGLLTIKPYSMKIQE